MTVTTSNHQTHRARAEQAAMDSVALRLAQQFPEMQEADITRAVRGQYEGVDDRAVRDVVPVPVERALRAELSAPPKHRA